MKMTLFIFVKSTGIRISFALFFVLLFCVLIDWFIYLFIFFGGGGFWFLVCFTQQSSLLKPVHYLFILLIMWSYNFVFNSYEELLLFRLTNVFILFENTKLCKILSSVISDPIATCLSVRIKQKFSLTRHSVHPPSQK